MNEWRLVISDLDTQYLFSDGEFTRILQWEKHKTWKMQETFLYSSVNTVEQNDPF